MNINFSLVYDLSAKVFTKLVFTCIPFKADTPMNKKTPYKTAIGIKDRIFAKKTLRPIRIDMSRVVTRCSLFIGINNNLFIICELLCSKFKVNELQPLYLF